MLLLFLQTTGPDLFTTVLKYVQNVVWNNLKPANVPSKLKALSQHHSETDGGFYYVYG